MVDYGLKDKVVIVTGTNNPWGIGAEFEKVVVPMIPMGKLIQPQDIAETILFLASEQARMITGQVLKVSGGKSL